MPNKLYYTLVEAQIVTGISQHSWRGWVQAGRVSFTRGGRRKILIPVAEIERVMKQGYQAQKGGKDGKKEDSQAAAQ